MIRAKVNGPGIAMIVLGSCSLTLFLLYGSMAAYGMIWNPAADDWWLFAAFCGLLLIKGLPMLYGGIQMMRLKNHGAAVVGAVVALLPCFYCWFAELGFGIWALVVLSDPFVTEAFRKPADLTADPGNPFGPHPS
jgi:hypothetical protein